MSPKTTQVKFFCVVGAGSFSVLLLCLAPIFAWGCSSMCVGGCSVFFLFSFGDCRFWCGQLGSQ